LESCRGQTGFDFSNMLLAEKTVLAACDYLIGNLETPIAYETMRYTCERYRFNTPVAFAEMLKDTGFHLVSTANNHCMDRGFEGLQATIDQLDAIGLKHIGTYKTAEERNKSFIVEIDGISIGFLAYTYGTNAFYHHTFLPQDCPFAVNLFQPQETLPGAIDLLDDQAIPNQVYQLYDTPNEEFDQSIRPLQQQIRADLARLRSDGSEYCVCLLHSGGQHNAWPDALTLRIADYIHEAGANAIIGHHPHVIHPMKMKGACPVAFSLGNFICSPDPNQRGKELASEYSIVLGLELKRCQNGVHHTRTSFSVHKSILREDGKTAVVPVDTLFKEAQSEDDRMDLAAANQYCVNKFLGRALSTPVTVQAEYESI
ncbi:MAG: CapA family protein, partial [Firmicutes bacterium]|nr:CapA family protein [Bacillota bacterium]